MPLIVTVPDFAAAAEEISLRVKSNPPRPFLVRVEGVCSVGKTPIAKELATLITGRHIEGDQYANKHHDPPPYPQCIRRNEWDTAIERALNNALPVALDAVCLREIASVERWGRGFNVYVKKLDFGGSNRPIWHDGLNLEDDPPPHEPHRSVHLYHLNIRPHETADLIIEVPGKDDQLPVGALERDLCLDPPGSTVVSRESG
jgi:hypothetical protein